MKKMLSVVLCIATVFCLVACGNTEEETSATEYVEYEIGSYSVELPEGYEYNDLTEVKAEPDCIAMLTDANGNYPDLWIYENETTFSTMKEIIMDTDERWGFSELAVYQKDGVYLGRTTFDEDWYGQDLYNVAYYKMVDDGKFLMFDFAYDDSCDASEMNAAILEIAEKLGF